LCCWASCYERINTNMAEGTPVQDHVLKMTSHLNKLEILGANIDREIQIDIVFQSLSESFTQFHLNYNMNKHSFVFYGGIT